MIFVCVKYIGCAIPQFFCLLPISGSQNLQRSRDKGLFGAVSLPGYCALSRSAAKTAHPDEGRFRAATPHYFIVTNSLSAEEARPAAGYLHNSGLLLQRAMNLQKPASRRFYAGAGPPGTASKAMVVRTAGA
jgi:hypothetical protein